MRASLRREGDTAVIRLKGRFDFAGHREFKRCYEGALNQPSVQQIDIDLRSVEVPSTAPRWACCCSFARRPSRGTCRSRCFTPAVSFGKSSTLPVSTRCSRCAENGASARSHHGRARRAGNCRDIPLECRAQCVRHPKGSNGCAARDGARQGFDERRRLLSSNAGRDPRRLSDHHRSAQETYLDAAGHTVANLHKRYRSPGMVCG